MTLRVVELDCVPPSAPTNVSIRVSTRVSIRVSTFCVDGDEERDPLSTVPLTGMTQSLIVSASEGAPVPRVVLIRNILSITDRNNAI